MYLYTGLIGWGKTYGGWISDSLMEVKLKVVDFKTCDDAMYGYKITKAMICAGGIKDEDTCQVISQTSITP